jgi:DNA (cytosine-5)-methyltransferase 1
MEEIRYIDLFCGMGAFHQAFKRHPAFRCVFASDLDEGARRIYAANHGLEPAGDIRKVGTDQIPDVDLICAGIPCQSFSIAGHKKGFGDDNGNLFWEVMRIVRDKKPRMVIIENVKNLATHDDGNTYKTIKSSLQDEGYDFFSKVIDSSRHGSPQCRQRIFMVAVREGEFVFPSPSDKSVSVSSILEEGSSSPWNPEGYRLVGKKALPKPFKPRIIFDIVSKNTGKGGRQGERVYDPSCCGITVCASSGGPGAKTGFYKVGDSIRRLGVNECLSMFGFPKDFDFLDISEEHRIHYLGNSIVVNVLEAMIPSIIGNFARSDDTYTEMEVV